VSRGRPLNRDLLSALYRDACFRFAPGVTTAGSQTQAALGAIQTIEEIDVMDIDIRIVIWIAVAAAVSGYLIGYSSGARYALKILRGGK